MELCTVHPRAHPVEAEKDLQGLLRPVINAVKETRVGDWQRAFWFAMDYLFQIDSFLVLECRRLVKGDWQRERELSAREVWPQEDAVAEQLTGLRASGPPLPLTFHSCESGVQRHRLNHVPSLPRLFVCCSFLPSDAYWASAGFGVRGSESQSLPHHVNCWATSHESLLSSAPAALVRWHQDA